MGTWVVVVGMRQGFLRLSLDPTPLPLPACPHGPPVGDVVSVVGVIGAK